MNVVDTSAVVAILFDEPAAGVLGYPLLFAGGGFSVAELAE